MSASASNLSANSVDFEYRPVNTWAVAAAAFGVLSIVMLFSGRDSLENTLLLAPLPLVGIALGVRALMQMRATPDQFSGGKLAAAGTALSAVCLALGLSVASYVYATEVPEGYVRTSFEELRPDETDQRGSKVVSDEIMKLDGKKVFIKGYIRPDSTPYRRNIAKFLLVRDNNQCCFGDITTVKYFDQVQVALTKDAALLDYSPSLYRLGGTLHVMPDNVMLGPTAPVFALEADYAK